MKYVKKFIDCYPLKILLYCVDTSALYLTSGPNLENTKQPIPYAGVRPLRLCNSLDSELLKETSDVNDPGFPLMILLY